MSVRKLRLSRKEEAEYIDCLKKMKAAGVNIEIPQRYLEKACPLNIFIAGGPASFLFDLPGGGAAFAIWVRLTAPRRITTLDCAIRSSWDDQIVLEAFFDERTPLWWLGKIDFRRGQVLNMRIMNGLTLNFGDMVEGWILASGSHRMPEGFSHGLTVPFTLVFLDQNENEIQKDGKIFVDRTWKSKSEPVSRGSGLYEPPVTIDPGFRPNLNRGRVRPGISLPEIELAWKKARADSSSPETTAALIKAISQMQMDQSHPDRHSRPCAGTEGEKPTEKDGENDQKGVSSPTSDKSA